MITATPRSTKILFVSICLALAAAPLAAQTPWIHIDIVESDEDGAHVKVNLPLSLAQVAISMMPEKIEAKFNKAEHGISLADLRNLWQALKETGDAEFVTVESEKENVRVARVGDLIQIRVTEATDSENAENKVEVDVPTSVVEALLGSDSEMLDVSAAIKQLETRRGDIVRINDGKSKVRVWIDEQS